MENKAHALLAGTFVVLVTALLVALTVWLMRDQTVRDLYEMSTAEPVSGLQPQAVVRFRGVPVGKVEKIGFDSKIKGNVLIQISVDRGAPVTKSVFATVASQGVTGLGFILLDDAGQSSEKLVSLDDDLPRIPLKPGGLDKLLKQTDAIFSQLEQASTKLNTLLADDNQQAVRVAIKEVGAAANQIGQAAGGINQLAASLQPTARALPGAVADIAKLSQNLRSESSATLASVKAASDEFNALGQRINAPGGPVDKLAEGSAALSAGVQNFTAATLPKFAEVAEETNRTLRQLRRTVNAVDDNPQALIFGNGPPQPGPGEAGFLAPSAPK